MAAESVLDREQGPPPRLRPDLTITRQVQGGETSYIVKVPQTGKYYRFREAEHALLSQLDGKRPLALVLESVQLKFPELGLTMDDLTDFLESLAGIDLLERTATEQNLILLEKLRDQRRRTLQRQSKAMGSLLYLHFKLWDPDAFFDQVIPYLRFVWTRPFVIGSLVLFAYAAFLNLREFNQLAQGVKALYGFVGYEWFDYGQIWVMSLVMIVFHEFGHGLTCKRFGGEVHDLGFLLIFLNPAMYCNVSDAYTFPNRWHKLYVTAAGGFVELWFWAVSTVIWTLSMPGTWLHTFCFQVLVVSGVSTLAMNFNPLVKLDGYYALLDILGVSNLRDNSMGLVKAWFKRHLFRLEVEWPVLSRRLVRIYALYGALCVLYTGLMMLLMLGMFKNLFLGTMQWLGVPFFALVVYLLYGNMARQLGHFLHGWWGVKVQGAARPRVVSAVAAAVLILAIALATVRLPWTVQADVTLDPAHRGLVRAIAAGWVLAVKVVSGERVHASQVVAVLDNPDLATDLAKLEARTAEQRRMRAEALYAGDLGGVAKTEAQLANLAGQLAQRRRDQENLTLRSPVDGVVVTDRVQDKVGTPVAPGAVVLEVADLTTLRARIPIPETELGDLGAGDRVVMMLTAFPGRELHGVLERVAPLGQAAIDATAHAAVSTYEGSMPVVNRDGQLHPGMTGRAKIYGRTLPLWQIWQRKAIHWVGLG